MSASVESKHVVTAECPVPCCDWAVSIYQHVGRKHQPTAWAYAYEGIVEHLRDDHGARE